MSVGARAIAAVPLVGAIALAASGAFGQSVAPPTGVPVRAIPMVASISREPPFATSLQIVPPGPEAEPDGMTYRMTLAWGARPGAAAYRVFTWTDAVRAWYRTAQLTTTRIEVHAFRSGCTSFIVVAVADPSSRGNALLGLETTNLVRFPLSARPQLCPARAD